MSGRTKRILYHIADGALFAVFGIGMLLISVFIPPLKEFPRGDAELWQFPLAVALAAVGLPVLLHECGHLLFGALAGMKPARFRFHPFLRDSVAGETAMYPRNGKHVKGKSIALTLGGAVVNIALGATLFLLWLLLPARPIFCGALSGFVFYEGVRALLPAELSVGKTDGAVLLGLLKNRPEEEVMLRVLTAQGILYRGSIPTFPKTFSSARPSCGKIFPPITPFFCCRRSICSRRGKRGERKKRSPAFWSARGSPTKKRKRGEGILNISRGISRPNARRCAG